MQSGASFQNIEEAFKEFSVSVCFKLQLKNYTCVDLIASDYYVKSGRFSYPPISVKSGEMEMMAGRKRRGALVGTEGIATWNIGCTGNVLSVMYSMPFSQRTYKNCLAVGIHNINEEMTLEKRFCQMYSEEESGFTRKQFVDDTKAVTFTSNEGRFTISGVMGKEYTCTITILFSASKSEEHCISGKY